MARFTATSLATGSGSDTGSSTFRNESRFAAPSPGWCMLTGTCTRIGPASPCRVIEPAPERTGHEGEHDVVDRHAAPGVRRVHDLVEVEVDERDVPAAAGLAVERRLGVEAAELSSDRRPCRCDLAARAAPATGGDGRTSGGRDPPTEVVGVLGERARHERNAARNRRSRGRRRAARVGGRRRVPQRRLGEGEAGRSVRNGVVDPEDRGDEVVLELDHVDPPERPVAVEPLRHQVGDDRAELLGRRRSILSGRDDVGRGLEIGVVHPGRPRQAEWSGGESPPQRRSQPDPGRDPRTQVLDGVAGSLRDEHLARVADDGAGLELEDPGVLRCQPNEHRSSTVARWTDSCNALGRSGATPIIGPVPRFRRRVDGPEGRERAPASGADLDAERRRLERLERSLRADREREREQAAAEVAELKRALRERLEAVSAHGAAPALGAAELEELKRTLRLRSEAVSERERALDEERTRLEREAKRLAKLAERPERPGLRERLGDRRAPAAAALVLREGELAAERAQLDQRAEELTQREAELEASARELERRLAESNEDVQRLLAEQERLDADRRALEELQLQQTTAEDGARDRGEELAAERRRLEALALELDERERTLSESASPDAPDDPPPPSAEDDVRQSRLDEAEEALVARAAELGDLASALERRGVEIDQLEQSVAEQRESVLEQSRELAARAQEVDERTAAAASAAEAAAAAQADVDAAQEALARREAALAESAKELASREAHLDSGMRDLAAREGALAARAAELDEQQRVVNAQRRTIAQRLEPVPEPEAGPPPASFSEGLRRLAGRSDG